MKKLLSFLSLVTGLAFANAGVPYVVTPGGTGTSNLLISANIPTKGVYVMVPFLFTIPNSLYLWASTDGTNFGQVGTDPIVNSYAYYSSSTAGTARDARVFEWRGKKYMSFWNAFASGSNPIGVLMESDNWTAWKTNSFLPPCPTGKTVIGPAQWFQDPADGRLYMVRVACDNFGGSGIGSNNVPYYSYLTNASDITSFSSPVLMGGTFVTNMIDPCFFYWNNKYWCMAKQECSGACAYIALFTSTNFTTGWTTVSTNDWAGWGVGYEGSQLVNNMNGTWSHYFEKFSGGGYYVSTCPYSTFPTNGWSTKALMTVPWSPSDAAMYFVTNVIDIAQISIGASSSLSQSKNIMSAGAFPDYDNIFGVNAWWGGTNYQSLSTWQTVKLKNPQMSGLYINFYTSTANNLQEFEFKGLDRTTGARSDMGVINKSGWVGAVAGTTVSGTTVSASTMFSGATYKITSATTLPTVTGTDVVLCNSNKVVYGVSATKTNLISDLR